MLIIIIEKKRESERNPERTTRMYQTNWSSENEDGYRGRGERLVVIFSLHTI